MAVFKHRVKLNGVTYEAGTEVPVETGTIKNVKSSETVVTDTTVEAPLTKAQLIEIAKDLGIEVKGKPTNAELEAMIEEAKKSGEEDTSNEGTTVVPMGDNVLTTPDTENETVNVSAEGSEGETGNEDEDSSFLNDVINGNE